MLRTNLATRPFYNTRAVRAALSVVAAVVLAFTAFDTIEIVRLRSVLSATGASAAAAEAEAARLEEDAERVRRQIDQAELETVAAAAREAKRIIDQRAFSWTALLSHFEATLPEDVRIRAIQPKLEGETFIVSMSVQARSAEDLDAFVEALESGGAFRNVLPGSVQVGEDDLLEATIDGEYAPVAAPAARAEAAR